MIPESLFLLGDMFSLDKLIPITNNHGKADAPKPVRMLPQVEIWWHAAGPQDHPVEGGSAEYSPAAEGRDSLGKAKSANLDLVSPDLFKELIV